jgi:hypothetical protein
MEVKKKILAIFRIIEASPYEDKTRYNQTIENLEKLLSPQDKKVMADVNSRQPKSSSRSKQLR